MTMRLTPDYITNWRAEARAYRQVCASTTTELLDEVEACWADLDDWGRGPGAGMAHGPACHERGIADRAR